jgi:hypothetical protein
MVSNYIRHTAYFWIVKELCERYQVEDPEILNGYYIALTLILFVGFLKNNKLTLCTYVTNEERDI